MCSEISSLFLNEIFFESFKSLKSIPFFKITAAETTGPARQPLPTSSTPAVIIFQLNFEVSFFISYHF